MKLLIYLLLTSSFALGQSPDASTYTLSPVSPVGTFTFLRNVTINSPDGSLVLQCSSSGEASDDTLRLTNCEIPAGVTLDNLATTLVTAMSKDARLIEEQREALKSLLKIANEYRDEFSDLQKIFHTAAGKPIPARKAKRLKAPLPNSYKQPHKRINP